MELAPHDIRVNAILPGWFPTAMTGDLPHTALGEQIREKPPQDDGVSRVIWSERTIFLASRASDFVAGTQPAINGGFLVADRLRDS